MTLVLSRNVSIEYRWAEGIQRLAALAADLVGRRLLLSSQSAVMLRAWSAKAATTTLPVVFTVATDPVRRAGLQPASTRRQSHRSQRRLCRDGEAAWAPRELRPDATSIGFLVNPNVAISMLTNAFASAASIGRVSNLER